MTRRRWTILLGAILLCGGLLWLLLDSEPIQEGRCRLTRRKIDPGSPLLWLVEQFVTPLGNKPDGVRDLPVGFEEPRYYAIKSGDKSILAVADYSQKLVRLCVDTNGDGILSEEQCFTAEVSKETMVSGRRQRLGPVSLLSSNGVGKASDGFYVGCFREDVRGLLMPSPIFFYTGKLRLAGKIYQVAVVDGDFDGMFKSILPLPLLDHTLLHRPRCDVFAIDLNGDGTFEHSLSQEPEVFPLGKLVRVADAYYAIDLSPDGSSLTLSETEPKVGTLAVDVNDAVVELRLWSDAADQHLRPDREWQLPAGKYTALHAVLTARDASGDIWAFSSLATAFAADCMGPLDGFTIQPGETTSIRIGPPFVVKAEMRTRTHERVVDISPVIVGCVGEKYSPAFDRNGKRTSPLNLKIVDEKGTVLVSEKCGYT